MNALIRGGRIRHCEHFQCGKGCDLGFGSILNFTTKVGTGMGEQFLSREYYYLDTQLPLECFLLFYFGFHSNNMIIMLSVQIFMIVLTNLGALRHETIACRFNSNLPKTDPVMPTYCANLVPIMSWVDRCVVSIFIVFFISFVPLGVQELIERGLWRTGTLFATWRSRFRGHSTSVSPFSLENRKASAPSAPRHFFVS